MKKNTKMSMLKRILAIVIAAAVAVSILTVPDVEVSAATGKVRSVAVTNLPAKQLTLKKGKTFTLKSKVTVTGKASKKVTYKTSNKKIATVNAKGKITAKKKGTAKIYVISKADKKKKCTVTVTVGTPVTKVKLNKTKSTMTIGKKQTLKATVTPKKASSKAVVWKSSNKKVATVTSKGVVKGIKKGTVKITATSKADKKVKKTITIKVKNIKPTGITLDKKELMLYEEGKTAALKAKLAPAGVYNKGIKWSVSDEEIISVDEKGILTPKKAGTAVVTAKTVEGGLAAECAVTVAEATDYKVLKPYTLVGYYAKDKINYVPVASDASVQMWDAATDKFEYVPYTKANIVGNYVQLIDLDNDKKADVLQVVKVKDGIKKWDSKMQWLDGAGEKADPAVSNEMGRKLFEGAEYRIPMGQRLLEGYGLGDYSGTTDFSIPAKQDTIRIMTSIMPSQAKTLQYFRTTRHSFRLQAGPAYCQRQYQCLTGTDREAISMKRILQRSEATREKGWREQPHLKNLQMYSIS